MFRGKVQRIANISPNSVARSAFGFGFRAVSRVCAVGVGEIADVVLHPADQGANQCRRKELQEIIWFERVGCQNIAGQDRGQVSFRLNQWQPLDISETQTWQLASRGEQGKEAKGTAED